MTDEQEKLNRKLLIGCYEGDLKKVKECISLGADINYKGFKIFVNYGTCYDGPVTPLMFATQADKNRLEIIKRLVWNKANVLEKDRDGNTAVTWAYENSDEQEYLKKISKRQEERIKQGITKELNKLYEEVLND